MKDGARFDPETRIEIAEKFGIPLKDADESVESGEGPIEAGAIDMGEPTKNILNSI